MNHPPSTPSVSSTRSLRVESASVFDAVAIAQPEQSEHRAITVVCKGTFELARVPALSGIQVPLRWRTQRHDKRFGRVRQPCDVAPAGNPLEVMVVGDAFATRNTTPGGLRADSQGGFGPVSVSVSPRRDATMPDDGGIVPTIERPGLPSIELAPPSSAEVRHDRSARMRSGIEGLAPGRARPNRDSPSSSIASGALQGLELDLLWFDSDKVKTIRQTWAAGSEPTTTSSHEDDIATVLSVLTSARGVQDVGAVIRGAAHSYGQDGRAAVAMMCLTGELSLELCPASMLQEAARIVASWAQVGEATRQALVRCAGAIKRSTHRFPDLASGAMLEELRAAVVLDSGTDAWTRLSDVVRAQLLERKAFRTRTAFAEVCLVGRFRLPTDHGVGITTYLPVAARNAMPAQEHIAVRVLAQGSTARLAAHQRASVLRLWCVGHERFVTRTGRGGLASRYHKAR